MSRRRLVDRGLVDQLEATLRDADAPLSCADLCELITLTINEACDTGYYGCVESDLGRSRTKSMGVLHAECLGNGRDIWTRRGKGSSGTIRRELDVLLRAGRVRRTKPGRTVLWESGRRVPPIDMTSFEVAVSH